MICECSISSLRMRASLASSTFSWAGSRQDAAKASSRVFIIDQDSPIRFLRALVQVWQEAGQKADHRQEGADLVHEADAGPVGQCPQTGRAHPAHAKREAEE